MKGQGRANSCQGGARTTHTTQSHGIPPGRTLVRHQAITELSDVSKAWAKLAAGRLTYKPLKTRRSRQHKQLEHLPAWEHFGCQHRPHPLRLRNSGWLVANSQSNRQQSTCTSPPSQHANCTTWTPGAQAQQLQPHLQIPALFIPTLEQTMPFQLIPAHKLVLAQQTAGDNSPRVSFVSKKISHALLMELVQHCFWSLPQQVREK